MGRSRVRGLDGSPSWVIYSRLRQELDAESFAIASEAEETSGSRTAATAWMDSWDGQWLRV